MFLEITWGPPDIFTLQLGVLVTLPDPLEVALVGQAELVFPSPATPVIHLRLDVIGAIRPDIPEVTLQAALVDSYIGPLKIEGGAAFLGRFGDERTWALTIGGFHPAFTPPPGLTPPARVGLDLDLGMVGIAVRTYFAVTSNTVQFGGEAVLYAEVIGLTIRGGFGMDVLVRLDPFGFTAEVWAILAVTTKKGREICGIGVSATVDGPSPWHFVAVVEARLLGIKASKRISGTFGDPVTTPRRLARPADRVRDALADPSAFHVVRADDGVVWAPGAGQVLGARDVLEVRQSIAPLDVEVEHLNELALEEGPQTLSLVSDGASQPLYDDFAPAAWQRLSEPQRLTRPSFEPGVAGLALTSSARQAVDEQRAPAPSVDRSFLDGTAGPVPPRPAVRRRAA